MHFLRRDPLADQSQDQIHQRVDGVIMRETGDNFAGSRRLFIDKRSATRMVAACLILPGLGRACGAACRNDRMAKAAMIKIKLLSTADTGYFYVTKKNARTKTEKLAFKKYDPVVRKHVEFKETKIK